MVEAFPELEVRKGIFHSYAWGQRSHWWLRDPDSKIIDPTARQHPDGTRFPECDARYQDLTDLTDEELVAEGYADYGKCTECGRRMYSRSFAPTCSQECLNAFAASIE